MQSVSVKFLILLSVVHLTNAGRSFASRSGLKASPVAKVVELLSGLETKIQKNAASEKKAHEEYVEWCKNAEKDLGFDIITSKSEIEDFTATIAKAKSDIATGTSSVEDLASTISQNDADLKAATGIREKEAAEFVTAERELEEVIDTLNRAINILERKLRGSALVQAQVNMQDLAGVEQALNAVMDAAALSSGDKKRLVALTQENADDDDSDVGAPAAQTYSSHSESIVEVLEDMREKATQQLREVQTSELNGKHNYELLAQSLTDQIAADNKEMSQANAAKAAAAETLATGQGDLSAEQKSLAQTEKTLKESKSGCATAAEDYELSSKSRAEELKAVAAAKAAITESTAGQIGFLQIVSVQQSRTASQMATGTDLASFEVVNLLRRLAKEQNSAALSQLASRVAEAVHFGSRVGGDPFAKVKSMIKEMVARLEKTAGEEATHKAWCDEQYGETKAKLDDLSHTVAYQTAKIDKAKAASETLKEEVKALQASLAEIAASQAEADKIRTSENKMYVIVKADLEDGIRGVRLAVKVLRDYYSNADGGHEKATGAGTSIIGFLEVIESDFSKSLAETEMDEQSAAVAYERVSMQNRLQKASMEKDVEYKTKEAASKDKSVSERSSDRESAQTELDAVLEYSVTIRGACENKPETYEDRRSRRSAEISGLKEALQILEQETETK